MRNQRINVRFAFKRKGRTMYKFKIVVNCACVYESNPYDTAEEAQKAGEEKAKYLYDNRYDVEIFGGFLYEEDTVDSFNVVLYKID